MTIIKIAGPTEEPVTLEEVKLFLRVDGTDEDALIEGLIASAREAAEHLTNTSLCTQTLERVIDAFPEVEIELGSPPVQTIVSVKYIDTTGAQQTLDSSAYSLDKDRAPGWVLPAVDTEWPDTLDTANAVRVRFTAGVDAAAVPKAVKTWIMLRVGTLYRFREQFQAGAVADLPNRFADSLLDSARVYW